MYLGVRVIIVSELVALLGFKTDTSGAREFDTKLSTLAERSNAVAAGISAAFAGAALSIATNLAQALGSGLANIPKAGDAMNTSLAKIETSIGRSATSAEEAEGIYNKLFESSQRTGVSADTSAGAFTRFNLAMQDVGRPAADTIKLIEGIQAAGIVAGTTTSELTASMLQLGQALGSGKLQGDELKSLRENMPTLLRDLTKELGVSQKEFFEQATKGLLTPERIIPALLKAGETATRELAKFPMSMGRSYAILTGSVTRFLAELDKQLNLSRTIAAAFVYIAQTLNAWRSGLSIVGDFIRELGGMRDMLQLVGIALLVAFGLSPIISMIKVVEMLGMAFVRSFLPLAIFGLFVLAVEDFVAWTQGKNSFFADFFGPFEQTIAPIKPKLEEVKRWFDENLSFGQLIENTRREFSSFVEFFTKKWESIKNAYNSAIEGMRPQVEWLIGAAELLMNAFRPLGEFFNGVFGAILKNINAFYDRVMVVFGGIKTAISSVLNLLPSFEGVGSGTDPEKQASGRNNFGASGALNNFINPELAGELSGMLGGLAPIPDVTGRVGGSTNNVNAPQNNNITNNIDINAPAGDAASIAAGVNAGMGRATESMTTRLGSSLALGLGLSGPRIEQPAMP